MRDDPTSGSLVDDSFQTLADEYVLRIRAGEEPSIDEYIARNPDLASEIQEEFPLLAILEKGLAKAKSTQRVTLDRADELSGYLVDYELGRGGMGVVYKAWQKGRNRPVALKVIYLDEANQPNAFERFQIEAKSISRLDHPNIVRVVDYGIEGTRAFLAMNFIDGCSLDKLVDSGSTSYKQIRSKFRNNWTKLADLGASVAAALQHSHEAGMIHRDVKPGNLIVDKLGKVWVTDFGLAKLNDLEFSISKTGDMIGTPRYMAAEQLRGVSDHRSDIYGLGVTLYELASGKRAWEDMNTSNLIAIRSTLELPPLSEVNRQVPPQLAKIIMKACAHHPEDRYQTAEELRFVLDRFARGYQKGDRRKGMRSSMSVVRRKTILVCVGASVGSIAGFLWSASQYDWRSGWPSQPFAAIGTMNPLNAVNWYDVNEIDRPHTFHEVDVLTQASRSIRTEMLKRLDHAVADAHQREQRMSKVDEILARFEAGDLDGQNLRSLLDQAENGTLEAAASVAEDEVTAPVTNEPAAPATADADLHN